MVKINVEIVFKDDSKVRYEAVESMNIYEGFVAVGTGLEVTAFNADNVLTVSTEEYKEEE